MSRQKNESVKEDSYDYDAIVIGTGPGGEGAAMKLAKGGLRVAVVERYADIGGGCTHWGTIPSKALRHSVSQLIELKNNALFNNNYPQKKSFFCGCITSQRAGDQQASFYAQQFL